MTLTDANIAISEADGWTRHEKHVILSLPLNIQCWVRGGEERFGTDLPSYTGPSGDPIRSAIARLPEEQKRLLIYFLMVPKSLRPIDLEGDAQIALPVLDMVNFLLASPLTLCTAFLRVVLNDPQLTIEQL